MNTQQNTGWKIEDGRLVVEKGTSFTVSQLADILAQMLEGCKPEQVTPEEREQIATAVMVQMAAATACMM